MESTGIVRKTDTLGRVVLPAELRKALGISIKDPLEIYVDGRDIILKAYRPMCILCGSGDDLVDFKGKKICRECIEKLK